MSSTSKMLPLGAEAPDFRWTNAVSNNLYTLEQLKGEKGTVVIFICNHCPYVKQVKLK